MELSQRCVLRDGRSVVVLDEGGRGPRAVDLHGRGRARAQT